MKRTVSLLLALVLLLCMTVPALAVPSGVQYDSTRQFLQILDEEDILYAWRGLDSDNDEKITISYTLLDDEVTLYLYFEEGNEHCSIRLWDMIEFDESMLTAMYAVCNALNSTYKYCTFYVDDGYYSVTVSMDLIFREQNAGDVCFEALVRFANICDDAAETLIEYVKK